MINISKMKVIKLTILIFLLSVNLTFAEKISFSAESMNGKEDYAFLSGNATLTTKDIEIFADSIELSGKDFRYIKANGNVKGKSSKDETDFSCETFSYDRKTEVAILQNKVHLLDKKNETDALAELMEYNQAKKTVIMQIDVSIKQKDNNCTGSYALYHQDTELLFLTGNPKVEQGQDTFRGQEITLNLKTQEVTIDGRVRGSVTKKED